MEQATEARRISLSTLLAIGAVVLALTAGAVAVGATQLGLPQTFAGAGPPQGGSDGSDPGDAPLSLCCFDVPNISVDPLSFQAVIPQPILLPLALLVLLLFVAARAGARHLTAPLLRPPR